MCCVKSLALRCQKLLLRWLRVSIHGIWSLYFFLFVYYFLATKKTFFFSRRFYLPTAHSKTVLKGLEMWFECMPRIKVCLSAPYYHFLCWAQIIMMMLLERNCSARYFIFPTIKMQKYFTNLLVLFLFGSFRFIFFSCFFLSDEMVSSATHRIFKTIKAWISTKLFTLLLHIIVINEYSLSTEIHESENIKRFQTHECSTRLDIWSEFVRFFF